MLQPLLLTLLGAAGTGFGGMMVVLQPMMNYKRLGALQGLAAGLMLSISLIDLLPEAVEEIGFIPANLCFYAGVLFFAVIVAFIPEPDAAFGAELCGGHSQPLLPSPGKQQQEPNKSSSQRSPHKDAAAAAAPQAAGDGASMQAGMRRRSNNNTATSAASSQVQPSSAALDTSCPGYAPPLLVQPFDQEQQEQSPRSPASTVSADLRVLLSEEGGSRSGGSKEEALRHKQQLLMSGLITALGIALHNFPEGLAVLLASHKSTAVGVSLACAIALHNIPEGVSVALPVYFATGSRWRGLQAAVLSGLAEPLAVILLGLVLPSTQLNKHVVDGMLAGVGGIMAFLAFHELLPLSMEHAGKPLAVGCCFAGMGLMSLTLHSLNTYVLADLH